MVVDHSDRQRGVGSASVGTFSGAEEERADSAQDGTSLISRWRAGTVATRAITCEAIEAEASLPTHRLLAARLSRLQWQRPPNSPIAA